MHNVFKSHRLNKLSRNKIFEGLQQLKNLKYISLYHNYTNIVYVWVAIENRIIGQFIFNVDIGSCRKSHLRIEYFIIYFLQIFVTPVFIM